MTRNFRFHIKDFGCKVNQYDARLIARNLERMGNTAGTMEEADVVFVNTCSVTERALSQSVRYSKKIRSEYPAKEVIAIGCSAREGGRFGGGKIGTVPQFIYLDNPRAAIEEFYGHTRAFLKVQQGCRAACTYCCVRKLKFPHYAKSPEAVITEMEELAKKHGEIVLCATNFNEYPRLEELAGRIKDVRGLFRWRFSSLPPGRFTDGLLGILADDPKFCRHFHLPVQSANSEVLGRMGRGYTAGDLEDLVSRTGRAMPGTVFSYDIITGFPGETEAQFAETLEFIRRHRPVKVHVFRYSERPGTPAAGLSGKVPEKLKRERMTLVKELSESIRQEHLRQAVGSVREVVPEKGSTGYSREYLPVRVRGLKRAVSGGPAVYARICGFDGKSLVGSPVQGPI